MQHRIDSRPAASRSAIAFLAFAFNLAGLTGAATPAFAQNGMLIMAHGGSDAWNAAVTDLADSLREQHPVEVAFGMADPRTLQVAVDALEERGVDGIVVIRLFVSAASFLDATQYYFGLRSDPPGSYAHRSSAGGHNGDTVPSPLSLSVPVRLSDRGLLDAPMVGAVLRDRVRALSLEPASESVLIIGHGPASDDENAEWLRKMDGLADSVRTDAAYHEVRVATLREDWTGKRKQAEVEIRRFVESVRNAGRDVVVVPFRLNGFGPYAKVLDGLPYRADGLGLLPDDRIAAWVESEFARLGDRLKGF